jgi:hypothetical protein
LFGPRPRSTVRFEIACRESVQRTARSAAKEETMSTSGRNLRKKRDRALDRRQQSKLPLDRADELIVGDGMCGPRRSGFILPMGGESGLVEMARKQG